MSNLKEQTTTRQTEVVDEIERPLGTLIVVFDDEPPTMTKMEGFMRWSRHSARDQSGSAEVELNSEEMKRRERGLICLGLAAIAILILLYSSWSGHLEALIRSHFG